MIKRELAKDPDLANENWERFLPNFKRRTLSKRRKPFKVIDKSKKVYTPFPPAQEKSKVDLEIESGTYFMAKSAKVQAEKQGRLDRQRERTDQRQQERAEAFVPPGEEKQEKKTKKRKREINMETGEKLKRIKESSKS